MKDGGWDVAEFKVPTAGNRDGTVPALARRAGLLSVGSEAIRSGKPS
jgi:hypothetical protein